MEGHTAEVISLSFSSEGDKVITGSFDGKAKLWDIWSGICIDTLDEHT